MIGHTVAALGRTFRALQNLLCVTGILLFFWLADFLALPCLADEPAPAELPLTASRPAQRFLSHPGLHP